MAPDHNNGKRFVGFGFGPIQSGLMLLEAQRSGNFDRYAVAEIEQPLVDAVRANAGTVTVNVAHPDGIERVELAGIEVLNPRDDGDRKRLGDAIRDADEMATAVPNVSLYTAGGAASIASVLARNLHPDKPRILYAAENDNYAAERLDADVRALSPADGLGRFQILNTVIGKMSGVIRDPAVLVSLGLAPLTPSLPRAVLVEEFNRILVSKVSLAGFRRGIAVFDEKPDLLPFEEAKLFGHNAVHALLGYMACLRGYRVMSEIRDDPDLLAFGRLAFVAESGEALVRKHGPTGDPLFTPEGYAAYADDLLRRMTNPFLHDEVERVCRDPVRKLGPNDRLVGAMREALRQGIEPRRMARGGAAALRFAADRGLDLGPGVPSPSSGGPLGATAVRSALRFIWGSSPWDAEREQCARLIAEEEMHLEEGGS